MTPGQEDTELLQTIAVIKYSIERANCEAVVWTGDINADFMRGTNHTDIIQEALDDLSFYTAWEEHSIGFACVHEVGNTTTVSKIDHFFLSSSINNQVEEAGVINHVNNKSDDSPVFAV